MRSALTFLLIAAFWLLTPTLSSAQQIDPQSGAVCEPMPIDKKAVRERAEAGDAAAEYEVGRLMLNPNPADDEVATAMPWFQRSAEQGYAPAEYSYGGIFREGRWENPQQLVYWWTKAAEQGEVRAQLWLGVFYEQGKNGVKRDYSQAFKWLSMAAKQGQPDAQVTLGQMYENGEGIPQDNGLAAYWYRKAANHVPNLGGAGAGLGSLAQLYWDGHATPQDYAFVYLWYAWVGDSEGMGDVTKKMNTNQLAEAQRRAREWFRPHSVCSSAVSKDLAPSQPQ
jgi:TPR repeat protein